MCDALEARIVGDALDARVVMVAAAGRAPLSQPEIADTAGVAFLKHLNRP